MNNREIKENFPGPGSYNPNVAIDPNGSYFFSKYKNTFASKFNPPTSKRFNDKSINLYFKYKDFKLLALAITKIIIQWAILVPIFYQKMPDLEKDCLDNRKESLSLINKERILSVFNKY